MSTPGRKELFDVGLGSIALVIICIFVILAYFNGWG